ncbi:unnamed protein product [Rotaria sordida]|uniref:Uncharacterized protein n=1 Tax=Rotaria sordida TaxID=392033 RepID=A0A814Q8M1_9BILA|nr:unnamed protein product [Rotaria sordida]
MILKIIKKLPWHLERIKDICWSSTFHRFILTTENYGICFVYENTISLDNANCFKQEKFHSCTCSNTSLFLTVDDYGSSIMEYHLLPSIELIKQWKSPYTCTKDEYIDSIRYNNEKFSLIIQKFPEKILKIELRSIKTLDRLWSIQLDMDLKPYQYGKIKETYHYNPRPYNATLFRDNILAILTESGINFHKL